jgi:coproporphyrinogen III oxidase-like Fe-S oxidoreductase
MSKKIVALALAAAMTAGTVIPAAHADRDRRHYRGDHHERHHGHHRRHGRGYWKDGKWIALGILGAATAAAIADSQRDCWYRNGRRYCDD